MNQRTVTQWLGAALFVSAVSVVALAGVPPPAFAAQVGLLGVAGALFFAGGVTDRVRWSLLVGVGNVALGASLAVGGLTDAGVGDGSRFYTVAAVVGGLTLAAIGVLYVVDYEGFDTEP